jgi:tripartite-type tricarboxylate transporter receptor subunit TctC
MVALPQLMKSPPYASLSEMTAVASVGLLPFCVFVHPDVPARSLADLAAIARQKPGALNFATGSLSEYLAAAQWQKSAAVTMERVPYKGGSQLMPDLVAGRVQVNFGPASTGMTYVKAGRLRALATLLPARSSLLPDVPTAIEAGYPEVKVPAWQALFAPPHTSRDIANRLSRAVAEALVDPETIAQFDRIGVQPAGSTPERLEAMIREDQPAWNRFIRDNGIEAE